MCSSSKYLNSVFCIICINIPLSLQACIHLIVHLDLPCDNIVLAGSEEGEPSNYKASVCYNAYTLIISGNMWYNTNILKIHTDGMATL